VLMTSLLLWGFLPRPGAAQSEWPAVAPSAASDEASSEASRAASGAAQSVAQASKPKVVATVNMIETMARYIGGDKVEIVPFMPVGADPHLFEATPSDARKIAEADLILKNGLTLEGWLNELIDNSGTQAHVVRVTEGVTPIVSPDHEQAVDPHAWADPLNGIIYARNVAAAFSQLLPQHADFFRARFDDYEQELLALHQQMKERFGRIQAADRVLITNHDAFQYFGRRYNFRILAAMGTSTDSEVQNGDIQEILRAVDATGVRCIFAETSINPKLMEQITKDAGIMLGRDLYTDSVGEPGSGADTYLAMLRSNMLAIYDGLTGQGYGEMSASPNEWALLLTTLLLFGGTFLWVLLRIRAKAEPADAEAQAAIRVRDLWASYGEKPVLQAINLDLAAGRVIGLMGGNGAGKTTLLKSMLGLHTQFTGQITRGNGQPLRPADVAYVPQRGEIDWQFPATVWDVVAMGRQAGKGVFERFSARDRELTRRAIERLGLQELAHRQIGALSGGQQQRTFVARALCQEAPVLFLDEPFVGIDATTEREIATLLSELATEGKLVMVIHHDLSKATDYLDEVVLLNRELIAHGSPEAVLTDANLRQTYGASPRTAQVPILLQAT